MADRNRKRLTSKISDDIHTYITHRVLGFDVAQTKVDKLY
jgi:hypothetical protein